MSFGNLTHIGAILVSPLIFATFMAAFLLPAVSRILCCFALLAAAFATLRTRTDLTNSLALKAFHSYAFNRARRTRVIRGIACYGKFAAVKDFVASISGANVWEFRVRATLGTALVAFNFLFNVFVGS